MNERIRELMIEAGARFEFLHGVHYDDFQYEKFAELIVAEATGVLQKRFISDLSREDMEVRWCIEDVKKHFGVEE